MKKNRCMAMHMRGVVDDQGDAAAFPAEPMTKEEYIYNIKLIKDQWNGSTKTSGTSNYLKCALLPLFVHRDHLFYSIHRDTVLTL